MTTHAEHSPTKSMAPLPPDFAALHRRALHLEILTTLWNVAEAVIAIGSGAVAGSSALVAFGVDSLIEVSSAVAVLWRLVKAGPGASFEESEHADRRAQLLVGLTFLLLATYVLVDAGLALLAQEAPRAAPVGIALAAASLIAMPALAYAKQRTARRMGSKALEADAVETWLCAYLSATLLLGLALNASLGWWWADPVAALAMIPFMVWQGRRSILEAQEDHDGERPGAGGDVAIR
jgi:divalent metal cation (Fe/Co/Zn/Cd) transporter